MVIIVAILGELLGSTAGYAIGRFGGRTLVDRVGKYVLLTHKDLDRAEAWFARRGEPVVLFGRFIPLLRSFVSFAAGLGEMALPKFAIFTVIGCAVWCTALCSLGYNLAGSYNHVLKAFSYAGYVLGALAVIAVALVHLAPAARGPPPARSGPGRHGGVKDPRTHPLWIQKVTKTTWPSPALHNPWSRP